MAVFDRLSRYVKPKLDSYTATDRRGRSVQALPMREPRPEASVGEHVKKQGQRLDHLAGGYLSDPHGFWRIAEANGAVLPDALSEVERVKIPSPVR
jgi:hypothetical protein